MIVIVLEATIVSQACEILISMVLAALIRLPSFDNYCYNYKPINTKRRDKGRLWKVMTETMKFSSEIDVWKAILCFSWSLYLLMWKKTC